MCCDRPVTMTSTVKVEITIDEEIIYQPNLDIVKDEPTECADELNVKSEITQESLMLSIIRPNLVYTTKLEDMAVLKKDLSEYSAKEVLQMLQAESKPKYSSDNILSTHSATHLLSYDNLVRFVDKVKHKAKLEAEILKQRNLDLMAQCKPCKIILHDINRTTESNRPRKSSSDDDITLIEVIQGNIALEISSNKTLLLALVHGDVAYVYRYCLTSKAVTNYFVIKQYKYADLRSMYVNDKINVRHYCCWYKREVVIENLTLGEPWTSIKKNLLSPLKTFLKQKHSCPLSSCSCCCKIEDTNAKIKSSEESRCTQMKKSTPLTAQSSFLSTYDYTNLIHRAIFYKPKEKVENEVNINEVYKTLFVKNNLTLLCFENKAHGNPCLEFHVMGKGELINSFTLNTKQELDNVEKYYNSMSVKIVKRIFCCWYSRDESITSLRTQQNLEKVDKYLRTSHSCEVNKCVCCCKPEIPEDLRKRILARENTYTHWPAVLNHTTAYNKTPTHVTIHVASITKKHIENNEEQERDTNEIGSRRINISKESKPKLNKLKNRKSDRITKRANNFTEEDKTILDKFKKLKINVNSDGDLEAVLDSPARDLSITELKVLHHILALSIEQIEQMQITPEEFCHRVNTKETNDMGNTQSIQTSIFKELSNILRKKSEILAHSFSLHFKSGIFSQILPVFRVYPEKLGKQNSRITTKSLKKYIHHNNLSDNLEDLTKRKTAAIFRSEDRIRVKRPSELIDCDRIFPDRLIAQTNNSATDKETYILGDSGLYSQYLTPNNSNNIGQNLTLNNPAGIIQRVIVTNSDNSNMIQNATSNQVVKLMTLGPMPSNNGDVGMLSNMLMTPQTQPFTAPYYTIIPPLVPIGSPAVFFTDSTIPGVAQSKITEDREGNIIPDNSSTLKAATNPAPKIILEHRKEVFRPRIIRRNVSQRRRAAVEKLIISDDESQGSTRRNIPQKREAGVEELIISDDESQGNTRINIPQKRKAALEELITSDDESPGNTDPTPSAIKRKNKEIT